MKKLFISCPMKGRTDENIHKSMEKMHKLAEIVFGEELEVIPSYIEGEAPEDTNQAIFYLGRSIQFMSKADYFIGLEYTSCSRGCDVERRVASMYGIKSFLVDIRLVAPDKYEYEEKTLVAMPPVPCEFVP